MNKKNLIFCIFSIFLLLFTSSVSAIEYSCIDTKENFQYTTMQNPFQQIKIILQSKACPPVILLELWMFFCYGLIILERITIGVEKPVAYAIAAQIIGRIMLNGIYQIDRFLVNPNAEPPIFSIEGWLNLSPEMKRASLRVFIYAVIFGSFRVSIVNRLVRK